MVKTETWVIINIDPGYLKNPKYFPSSDNLFTDYNRICQPPKPPFKCYLLTNGVIKIEALAEKFQTWDNIKYCIEDMYPDACILNYHYEKREVEKKMNFEDVISSLRAGKKMRRRVWGDLRFIKKAGVSIGLINRDGIDFKLSGFDLFSEDWEEYIEGHNWDWALSQMENGGTVRRMIWEKGAPGVRLSEGEGRFKFSNSYDTFCIGLTELNATDWILQ